MLTRVDVANFMKFFAVCGVALLSLAAALAPLALTILACVYLWRHL